MNGIIMQNNRLDHELAECVEKWGWKYHHLGIPTREKKPDEKYLPQFKFYVSGFEKSPFGIEWMRFEADSPIHPLIQTIPHLAFEVKDLNYELTNRNLNVITEPNPPSDGVRVAMIEHNGAPIELIEFRKLEEMSVFFNTRASIYEEKHLEHIDGMESKQILASFFPSHTKTMIDLGIGTGLELDEIFKRFPEIEVTGLDIAEDMLKLLVEKYPDRKIRLHCESYFDYDFGKRLYDVALSVMTLHHYPHQTKTNLYRKTYNSLKNNGIYIECDYMLSEHEYENPQELENFYFTEFERLKKEQEIMDNKEYHFDTPCTVANQKKMLLEAGFSNVEEVWRQKNTVIIVAKK